MVSYETRDLGKYFTFPLCRSAQPATDVGSRIYAPLLKTMILMPVHIVLRAGFPYGTGYTKPPGRSDEDDLNISQVGSGALAIPGMNAAPTGQMGVKYTQPESSFNRFITKDTRTMSTISLGMAVDDTSP